MLPGNWLDWLLLLFVLFTVLGGARRGLVFEVVSLLGWVLAWLAAWSLGDLAAMYLPLQDWPQALREGIGFVVVLLVVKLLMWALAIGLRALLHASVLRAVDRWLGGAFGLLRGVLLLGVVAWLVMKTPLREQPIWVESKGAACLAQVVELGQSWIGPKAQSLRPRAAGVPGMRLFFVDVTRERFAPG